jgi:uncharacterized protein (TIGR02466 family)
MKKLTALFPTPVLSNTLDRNLTDLELAFIKETENKKKKNAGNYHSIDTQILENPELQDIKKFCMANVTDYFQDIICPINSVEPYICLSWLNYMYQNGFHHRHCHSNSIISGVFYIQTSSEDKIYFHNLKEPTIKFHTDNYHEFNSVSWWVPAEKNTLILFPSDLWHEVKIHSSTETRISLSFNVFVKGKIGDLNELSYIRID